MYPADTLQQAQAFYKRPSAIERTLTLESRGWEIFPTFHFGFMAKGFGWTNTTLPLAKYLSYWQKNIVNTAQVERPEWDAYWNELVKAQIAEPSDREQFDQDFTKTNRQVASPRPGFRCVFAWALDDAECLDDRGHLTKAVRERINQVLEAIGDDKIG
jgi:hypothetical protein